VLLLALDTSTPAITVAVVDGTSVLAARDVVENRPRHAELLVPLLAQVLAEAGVSPQRLDGVAVGVGPGPFTSLRIGLATADVFAAALDLPVHGVCSLDVLAADVVAGLPAAELAGGFGVLVASALDGAGVVELLEARPLYLRRPDAVPPGAPKAALA
jgi:tRNA threonylcarbamoyladenosine biosynthesis protein TsaB